MIKYYCDRCEAETDADFYRFNKIVFENKLDRSEGGTYISLCPKCVDEVKGFIGKKLFKE